jgi:hypothetical protein
MLLKEVLAVYYENIKHINTLCGQYVVTALQSRLYILAPFGIKPLKTQISASIDISYQTNKQRALRWSAEQQNTAK